MSDWLVPVRKGENPELRYAIRSWVRHAGMVEGLDRLVTVGDHPDWLEPDLHIPGNLHRSGPVNVFENIRTACTSGLLGDRAVIANDDMFAVDATDPTEVCYRRPLAEHIRGLQQNTWWSASLRLTHAYLRAHGVPQPLSFELHRPLAVNTAAMGSVLAEAWSGHGFPPQWRTLYGNLAGPSSPTQARDSKVLSRRGEITGPWISTTDGAWKLGWGDRIMHMFPEPTMWENDNPARQRKDTP